MKCRVLPKELLFFLMWYPLRVAVRFLPRELIYHFGVVGGRLLYMASKEKANLMASEVRKIVPSETNHGQTQKIVKKAFVNYCLSELEVLFFPTMNQEFIRKHVFISGKEHLDSSLKGGKGVLLFQAHFGAFQMVMPAIGYEGYKLSQISAPASVWKEGMNSKMQKKGFDIKTNYENLLPVQHIPFQTSIRPVFRALQRNEIVGVTVDGEGGKKWIELNFLGRKANFAQGPVEIALRTGAAIVPAFIISKKNLSYELNIHPPLEVDSTKSKNETMNELLHEFVKILERYVRQYPEQYAYMLYFRRANAASDQQPFFDDYAITHAFSDSSRNIK